MIRALYLLSALLPCALAQPPWQACEARVSRQGGPFDCWLTCGLCKSDSLTAWMAAPEFAALCTPGGSPVCSAGRADDPFLSHDTLIATTVQAILNLSAVQGGFLNDFPGAIEENATQALTSLVAGMPRRDLMLLFEAPVAFSEWLLEHVRYSLFAWRTFSAALGVTWDDYVAFVLPYAVLDEKRDVAFRWRPRFFTALMPIVANATSVLGAMKALVAALPATQIVGAVAQGGVLSPGQPITWHSESSPARLSVQDTVQVRGREGAAARGLTWRCCAGGSASRRPLAVYSHSPHPFPSPPIQWGSSCTGTGVTQVAAARSVGLPARLAGCSESVVRGDDHHWTEVLDRNSAVGPFKNFWHTREGASKGNEEGPWDAPSAPMLGCLQGVVPGSSLDSIWATSALSQTYLPALWANDARSITWSFVGGVNVCGDYCTAWGCGVNNSLHYTQAQCGPWT